MIYTETPIIRNSMVYTVLDTEIQSNDLFVPVFLLFKIVLIMLCDGVRVSFSLGEFSALNGIFFCLSFFQWKTASKI